MKLTDLNALHLRDLYADLLAHGAMRRPGGLSAATASVVHRVLRKAFNDAVLWGLIARSPLLGVKPPRLDPREMRS